MVDAVPWSQAAESVVDYDSSVSQISNPEPGLPEDEHPPEEGVLDLVSRLETAQDHVGIVFRGLAGDPVLRELMDRSDGRNVGFEDHPAALK